MDHLFNAGPQPDHIPDHPFFRCTRWDAIGSGWSFYHAPFSLSKMEKGYIFSRSDIKNYDDEIRHFLDWLRPYIAPVVGRCIGWTWYEEADQPTLLYCEAADETPETD